MVKLESIKADGCILMGLTGELSTREDQQLVSQALDERLNLGDRVFVLDLSEVTYVSSLGIAILVSSHVKVNKAGGKLRLVNPRPRIAQLLEATKVSDMFKTYSTVAEALGRT